MGAGEGIRGCVFVCVRVFFEWSASVSEGVCVSVCDTCEECSLC